VRTLARIFGALGELAYYAVVIAVLGALVHLVVILLIPQVATRDAYAALTELGAPGQTTLLPRASPGTRRFPYFDPAVAAAMCRYDLGAGPVRVRAPLGRAAFNSISLHSRRGAVFYALTDRAASASAIEAVIVTAAQLRALQASEDEENPSSELRIVSPTVDGYVVRRVFSETPSLYAEAEAEAQTLSCATEPMPK
jgi:uncharacterized membrane protein